MTIEIYYINLNRSKDRLESCKKELDKHKVNATRFEAVDGKEYCGVYGELIYSKINTRMNYKLLRQSLVNEKKLQQVSRPIKVGEIGMIQSLRELFKNALHNNKDKILVLEDDFKLCIDFKQKLEYVVKVAPENANILYLGLSPLNYKYGAFQNIDNDIWQRPTGICDEDYLTKQGECIRGSIFGCYGFIIDSHAMQCYLDLTDTMTYPCDVILGHLANKYNRINSYSLKKHLITYYKLGTTIHHL
tara:strand:+ start:326 stop:1063 length:738 start_codon:yes stop_codon:yes gene_type:complete